MLKRVRTPYALCYRPDCIPKIYLVRTVGVPLEQIDVHLLTQKWNYCELHLHAQVLLWSACILYAPLLLVLMYFPSQMASVFFPRSWFCLLTLVLMPYSKESLKDREEKLLQPADAGIDVQTILLGFHVVIDEHIIGHFSQRTFPNPVILHPLKPEKRSTLELPFMLFATLHFVINKKLHAQFYASEIWSSVCKIVNRSPSHKVSCRHKAVIVLVFFIDAQLVELQCCATLWMNAMPCVAEGNGGLGSPLCFSKSNCRGYKPCKWCFPPSVISI